MQHKMAGMLPKIPILSEHFASSLFKNESTRLNDSHELNRICDPLPNLKSEEDFNIVDTSALEDYNGKERRMFRLENERIGRHLWFETRLRRETQAAESYIVEIAAIDAYIEDEIYPAIEILNSFEEKLALRAAEVQLRENEKFKRMSKKLELRREKQEEEMREMANDEYRQYQLPEKRPYGPRLGL